MQPEGGRVLCSLREGLGWDWSWDEVKEGSG